MPILDVELVVAEAENVRAGLAKRLADAAGKVFGTPQGSTWVKVRQLPRSQYAENGVSEPEGWGSVFVTVLKARRPANPELAVEMKSLAEVVAAECERSVENVHVFYETEAAGRIG